MKKPKLKYLLLSAIFILFFSAGAMAQEAAYQEKMDSNPFNNFNQDNEGLIGFLSPAIADITGDGKLEAIVGYIDSFGNSSIKVLDFDNVLGQFVDGDSAGSSFSTGTAPSFTNARVTPTLYNWESGNEHEFELFLCVHYTSGSNSDKILYFKKDANGKFEEQLDGLNPFDNVNNLNETENLDFFKVAFEDLNGDVDTGGHLEAFVGSVNDNNTGILRYYELTGGSYQEMTGENPMAGVLFQNPGEPKPFIFPLDQDDILFDVIVGTSGGKIRVFPNQGNVTDPIYSTGYYLERESSQDILFSSGYADPIIIDYDPSEDSDKDLFMGTLSEGIRYFEEIGTTPGDYDNDTDVDLADAILALKIVAGISDGTTIALDNRISGDAIGIEEAIFALREVAFP